MQEPFEWRCHWCSASVADASGHVTVDSAGARAAMKANREREIADSNRDNLSTLVGVDIVSLLQHTDKHPDLVWYTTHGGCDPRAETGDYWIDVARLRTLAQVLRLNADLSRKPWVAHTDWPEFLVRSLSQPSTG